MEKTAFLLNIIEYLLVEWKVVIIAFITFCAMLAIVLGIVWLFLRKDILPFIVRRWKKLLEV